MKNNVEILDYYQVRNRIDRSMVWYEGPSMSDARAWIKDYCFNHPHVQRRNFYILQTIEKATFIGK